MRHGTSKGKCGAAVLTWVKDMSGEEHVSPWGHLQQAEWWCILGPVWRTAHSPPSQCHWTITWGLQRPAAANRPPPLPREANHVIWSNDRVMTQIGGVCVCVWFPPAGSLGRRVVNTTTREGPGRRRQREHIREEVTEHTSKHSHK